MGVPLPQGFRAHVANVGIKDDTDDFTVVAADAPCAAAGVFTRSSFAGPERRRQPAQRRRRAGPSGRGRLEERQRRHRRPTAWPTPRSSSPASPARLGCSPGDVLVASTGVIGRHYPMDRVRAGIAAVDAPLPLDDAEAVATAIMTTDTVRKVAAADIAGSAARVVGVAKGVGMIEPDMATLITLFFTDAGGRRRRSTGCSGA